MMISYPFSRGWQPEILIILSFIKSLLTSLFQREDLFPSLEKRGKGRFLQFYNHLSLKGYIISVSRFIIIITVLFLLNCHGDASKERVLFDFESDSELDRIHWKCHTLFSLSSDHIRHGGKSLKMELYPSDYPGLDPKLEENDWRGYKALCFDIYNPEEKKVQISVRIDDQKDYPEYKDRYNERFILNQGMNQISIPFNTLITSGTSRNLDLKNIYRLLIFKANPDKKVVLYVDYIRLI